MNEQNDAQDQSPSAHDKDVKMMDSIRADRACIKCGFNLFGQEVFKEDHYQLAVTRCPECGTVAALQSYPTMSHWVNRFRALIAAGWVVVLAFVFILQMSLVGTFADGMSSQAGMPLAKMIGKAYNEWAEENEIATNIAGWGMNTTDYTEYIQVPQDWTDEHLDEILDQEGGLVRAMDKSFVIVLIPASIAGFVLGAFWSIVLLGASRKKAAIVPISLGLIGVILMYSPSFYQSAITPQASEIAKELYATYLAPVGVIIQFPAILLGIFLGRKIARWVITLTLPPRSRVPFSIFWTRDGLALPSAKR